MEHRFEIERTWQGELLPEASQGWMQLSSRAGSVEVWWDAPFWEEAEPDIPPGRCFDLWRYQAVELFLGAHSDASYVELEFGPAGHWLALEFSGYRSLRCHHEVSAYEWRKRDQRWTGRAVLRDIPLLSQVCRGNAHFVHRCPHGRSHCSAHGDPSRPPDFHRSDLFLPLDGSSLRRV